MSSTNYRGIAWLDESVERSEGETLRVEALGRKWSRLHHAREQEQFKRQFDEDEGRCWEPDECGSCEGRGSHGLEFQSRRREYHEVDCPNQLHGIVCSECGGDGYDRSYEKREKECRISEDLEIEVVEGMLEKLGARMMRPYEHWNEDERYMEYMERDR